MAVPMKNLLASAILFLSISASAQSPAAVMERDFYWSALRTQLTNEQFIPHGTPVVIGDSRIQGIDFYPRVNVVNYGITGDTSAGMLNRLRKYAKPTGPVFLAGGVNDIGFGKKFDDEIVSNYEKMFAAAPETSVFVMGIFPVIEEQFPGYGPRIKAINKKLRTACNRRPRCTYIDLWSQLSTPRERARPEYMTKDGIHLNEAGGNLVVNAVINALPQ